MSELLIRQCVSVCVCLCACAVKLDYLSMCVCVSAGDTDEFYIFSCWLFKTFLSFTILCWPLRSVIDCFLLFFFFFTFYWLCVFILSIVYINLQMFKLNWMTYCCGPVCCNTDMCKKNGKKTTNVTIVSPEIKENEPVYHLFSFNTISRLSG
jgi:hypothetical protein